VAELLEDPSTLLRAFEGLIMLEGTSSNAKQAWNRCAGARGRAGGGGRGEGASCLAAACLAGCPAPGEAVCACTADWTLLAQK
jgi:hypothetical protein